MESNNLQAFAEAANNKEDILTFLSDIEAAEATIYKKGGFSLSGIEGAVSDEFFRLLQLCERRGILPKSGPEQAKFFKETRTLLESLETVRVTVAFAPDRDFQNKIRRYLVGESETLPVLDVIVKDSIIGGIILEQKGIYHDFSVADSLNKLVEDKAFLAGLLK